jgi:high-affinity Fe2+/Pb2+ permease
MSGYAGNAPTVRKTLWTALLSMLDPGQATLLDGQMSRALNLGIAGVAVVAVSLVITLVAFLLNIQGSDVILYLVIILVLMVIGIVIVLASMSMSSRANSAAKNMAMQRCPQFFAPDGQFSAEGMAFLRGEIPDASPPLVTAGPEIMA